MQSRKRFPKEAKVLVTARGEEKVVANDIFNERVTLRNVEGETRVVPLADLKREMAGGPMTMDEPAVEEEPDMMLELDEEVIRMTDTAERPAYRPGLRPGMPGFPRQRPAQIQRREQPGSGKRVADSGPVGTEGGDTRSEGTGDREQGSGPPSSGRAASPGLGRAKDPLLCPPCRWRQRLTPIRRAAPMPRRAKPTTGEHRSPRRRRGRRGGRRGRGRGDGRVPPNASGTSDLPTVSSDDGDDEGDDE